MKKAIRKTRAKKVVDFEQRVRRIFAVDGIDFSFYENKNGDVGKLEKYFDEKIKNFVLQNIIKHKIGIGGYLIFCEEEQESGVWHIELKNIMYSVSIDDETDIEKELKIDVLLDDFWFD